MLHWLFSPPLILDTELFSESLALNDSTSVVRATAAAGRSTQAPLVSVKPVLTLDGVSPVQDGRPIYALGKAHMRSTPSLRNFPCVALETVPMLVWLTMAFSRRLKEDHWGLSLCLCLSHPFHVSLFVAGSLNLWCSVHTSYCGSKQLLWFTDPTYEIDVTWTGHFQAKSWFWSGFFW